MALSLNKPKLDNLANEIWKSAERLRGKFKAYEYQGVILPIPATHSRSYVRTARPRAPARCGVRLLFFCSGYVRKRDCACAGKIADCRQGGEPDS